MSAPTVGGIVEIAVGGIVERDGAVLLIERGRPPNAGRWSIPGGRVRFGETLTDAVAREVLEETGVAVRADRFAGWVERMGDDPTPYHFVILDFFTTEVTPGAPLRPGDDAVAARWVLLDRVRDLDLVDGLADFLAAVGVGTAGRW